jgi:hypothetical protein
MGAAVVDIFPLLQFRRDGAAVVCTSEQTRKGKVVLAVLRFVVSGEHVLHSGEQIARDNRGMLALVLDPLPHEVGQIRPVLQHLFQTPAGGRTPRSFITALPKGGQGVVPAGVQLEGAAYQGGLLWVHVDRARQRVVTIADEGPPG